MVHLLNAIVTFFGIPLNLSSKSTIAWLIVAQVLIIAAVVFGIVYLVLRGRTKNNTARKEIVYVAQQPQVESSSSSSVNVQVQEPVVERRLTGISLDLTLVQRDFIVGEQFNAEGLVVRGEYNMAPTVETHVEFDVIDYDTYARLERRGKATGLYVIKPYMFITGAKVVTVKFLDYSVEYSILVSEAQQVVEHSTQATATPPVTQDFVTTSAQAENNDFAAVPSTIESDATASSALESETMSEQQASFVVQRELQIVEEDEYEAKLRYDKSFMARLIQYEDEIKHWYTDIKNNFLSYKGVKSRISWKRETFKCGGKLVLGKISYRGKVLCVFLPLNVADYSANYPVEDASDASCYEDTPLMIRLKNAKRVEIAKELIKTVMAQNGMAYDPHELVDYYVPYEGILTLINKGLIKRNIRTPEHESIFSRAPDADEDDDASLTLTKVGPGIYVTKK